MWGHCLQQGGGWCCRCAIYPFTLLIKVDALIFYIDSDVPLVKSKYSTVYTSIQMGYECSYNYKKYQITLLEN
jgi:hypothetical protein